MDDAATSGVAAVSSDAAATDVRQRRPAAELPLNPATAAAQPDAGIPETDAAEPVGDGNDASPDGGAASAEGVEPAEDVRACLFSLLQRKCPELRITCNALGMLEGLLDQVSSGDLATLSCLSSLAYMHCVVNDCWSLQEHVDHQTPGIDAHAVLAADRAEGARGGAAGGRARGRSRPRAADQPRHPKGVASAGATSDGFLDSHFGHGSLRHVQTIATSVL